MNLAGFLSGLQSLFGSNPSSDVVKRIRALCPGYDTQSLDEAVRLTLVDRDAIRLSEEAALQAGFADAQAQAQAQAASDLAAARNDVVVRDQKIVVLNQQIADLQKPPPLPSPPMSVWGAADTVDFRTAKLDTTKIAVYKGRGNQDVGWRSPKQVAVRDGELQITGIAWDDSFLTEITQVGTDPAKYALIKQGVSGGIAYKANVTYGRWEIIAKVDAGAGFGPAIGLWPQKDADWPAKHEIDIAESPEAKRDKVHTTVHYDVKNMQLSKSIALDATQWRTYVLEWIPSSLLASIDGVVTLNTTVVTYIPTTPHHLFIQNDVGAAGKWIAGRTGDTPAEVKLHVRSIAYRPYVGAK